MASSSGSRSPERPAWQRRAIRRFAGAFALIVAGLILTAAFDGDVGALGWGITGLGMTLATIFLFLEIGLSEDRARERGR